MAARVHVVRVRTSRNRLARCCAGMALILGMWVRPADTWAVGAPMPGPRNNEGSHVVGITAGFDPTFTIGITYAYLLPLAERTVALETALTAPVALIPHGDHASLRLGAATHAVSRTSPWNAWIAAGMEVAAGQTGVSRERSGRVYLAANPGYFTHRWYAGPAIRYTKTLVTHRRHTAWYRQVYPGAVDGWYANSTGFIVLGAAGGVALGKGLVVSGTVGYKLSDDFRMYDPFVVPASGEVSVGYRF